jgi:glyoxylase-like metal-dependent hydrolase (beta-lactamase superfamily II)
MASEQIMDNLSVLYGVESSNSYLLVGKQTIIIDPGIHKKAVFEGWLKELGFKTNEIDIVLLTHSHVDHFANAQYLTNAKIYISSEESNYLKTRDAFVTASKWFNNLYYPETYSIYKKDQMFDIGTFKLKTLTLPGHTNGGVGFYEQKKGLLFSGDTLFKGTCGRYDLLNSSKEQLLESLKFISSLDYDALLPGHGPIYNTSTKNQKEQLKKIILEYF